MMQLKLKLTDCGLLILALAMLSSSPANSQGKPGATLEVKVNYSGASTVDEKHKIYVVLWDSPDFVSGGAMPIELLPVTSKQGTAVFTVAKSPAYISVAFDPNGQWDGQSGPPPSGSSLGLYTKAAGKPEPIAVESGKKTSIELPFDDSIKMP